jgi:hypothetical protein
MSDEIAEIDDITDGTSSTYTPDPLQVGCDRLERNRELAQSLDMDTRRIESKDIRDELASEHARQVLRDDIEELYSDDLGIDNPPDSMAAFEDRVTLREHQATAMKHGRRSDVSLRHQDLVIDLGDSDVDSDEVERVDALGETLDTLSAPRDGARAKKAIDQMQNYGRPAAQFIAGIANAENVHSDVAMYALDALEEMDVENEDEPQSLTAALAGWFSSLSG